MRLTVKVVWTFKNGVEGAVLISSTSWFSFSLLYYWVQVQCILELSVPIIRIYIELWKEGSTYFWPQDSIEDFSPTWHGSAVTRNKTIVMLGPGWKEPSVPLGMLRVKIKCLNSIWNIKIKRRNIRLLRHPSIYILIVKNSYQNWDRSGKLYKLHNYPSYCSRGLDFVPVLFHRCSFLKVITKKIKIPRK